MNAICSQLLAVWRPVNSDGHVDKTQFLKSIIKVGFILHGIPYFILERVEKGGEGRETETERKGGQRQRHT